LEFSGRATTRRTRIYGAAKREKRERRKQERQKEARDKDKGERRTSQIKSDFSGRKLQREQPQEELASMAQLRERRGEREGSKRDKRK
jgi:hypothetical protein